MDRYERSNVETTRGFLLPTREWKIIGVASTLMVLNVLLMYVFVATPLSVVNEYLFAFPIVGLLVYGVALFAGERIAERGVENGDPSTAVAGVAILQVAFGTFGAGVLSWVPRDLHVTALVLTAVAAAGLTFLVGVYVYARSKDFDAWGTYANYAFLGGVAFVFVGTFFAPVLILGFVCIFAGFVLRLGWEVWRVREHRNVSAYLSSIGIYIAVMGVFVHILQLVARYLASRE